MAREDLPSVDRCVEIFHAALGAGDTEGVHAALLCLAVQDPRRAQELIDTAKTGLDLIDAVDAGRLGGITRADLRAWVKDDSDEEEAEHA